jgi:hypothetical protein
MPYINPLTPPFMSLLGMDRALDMARAALPRTIVIVVIVAVGGHAEGALAESHIATDALLRPVADFGVGPVVVRSEPPEEGRDATV